MSRADRTARNIKIRRRRANGELLLSIASDFGLTLSAVSLICVGVSRKKLRGKALADLASKSKAIPLDDVTLAEIAAAKRDRERAPDYQYKAHAGWPG